MGTRLVDIFDDSGVALCSYSVTLEGICLDGEFEEAALVLAEISGRIPPEEFAGIRASCVGIDEIKEQLEPRARGQVISLVKRRMQMAAARSRKAANRA